MNTSRQITLVSNSVLRSAWIAEHARHAHGARWSTDRRAEIAIEGAFDSIMPDGCEYRPGDGSIITDGKTLVTIPRWGDPQMLACALAFLATVPEACDLQRIFGTENIVA